MEEMTEMRIAEFGLRIPGIHDNPQSEFRNHQNSQGIVYIMNASTRITARFIPVKITLY